MPKLTIDGKDVEVAAGTTVLRAAAQAGVDIPHFCWHPGLSVDGNCRMCLVQVEKQPKLAISCATVCQDGMVVHTDSAEVKKAREGVLEFILTNHPLDCPICDCAGECDLQENYHRYSAQPGRFAEQKVHKEKVIDLGPNIVLDEERCILCSRCVRFCEEVTKTNELGIFGRGAESRLQTFPGKKLDNNYSTNTVDLCPVGALTDKRFRFQSRVWFLRRAESVCPGCERGCNIWIDYNLSGINKVGSRRVYRFKPRYNPEVNGHWMCDYGRHLFPTIDERRRTEPLVRRNGTLVAADWPQALERAAELLRGQLGADGKAAGLGVIFSRNSTNESLFALRRLFKDTLGVRFSTSDIPSLAPPGHDDILLREDKHANTRGAKDLGLASCAGEVAGAQMLKLIESGRVRGLVVVGEDILKALGDTARAALGKLEFLILLASHVTDTERSATVVLPISVFAEQDGTFTNFEGRVQRIVGAFPPPGSALAEWQVYAGLGRALGHPPEYTGADDLFTRVAAAVPAYAGLTWASLGGGRSGLLPAPTEKVW